MQNSTLGIHGEFNDIHICGACKTQFSDIQTFVLHKQQNCTPLILPNTTNNVGQCNLSILVPDPANQNAFDGSGDSSIHHNLVSTDQSVNTVELNCRTEAASSFVDSPSIIQSNEPRVTTRSRSFLRSGFGKRPSGKLARPTATVQPQRQRSSRPLQASNIRSSESNKQLNSEPNSSTLCISNTNFSSNIDFPRTDNVHGVPSSSTLSTPSSSTQQILSSIPLSQTVATPQGVQSSVIHTSTVITPFQTNIIFTPTENNACHSVLSMPTTGDSAQASQTCIFPSNASPANVSSQHPSETITSLNVGVNHSQQTTNITQTCNNIQPDTNSVQIPSEETCSQQLILPAPPPPINNGMFSPATDSPDFFVTNELNVAVSTNGVAETLDHRDTESPGITVINEIRKSKIHPKYRIVRTDGMKRYKCEYESCIYTTLYKKDMDRHFRIHTGERPYLCQKCGKTFNRIDKMRAHEKSHTGVRPHKCNTCPYATTDKSSLAKHLRIHTDERPFKCQICPYASRSTSQLVVHLRTHTGDAPFHCFVCSAKFKINSDLKRHVRQHTGEKPFKCTMCNYRSSVKVNLTIHNRLNHATDNQFKCSKCEFSTPSRKKLREHEYIHSNKSVSCPQCTYTTSCKKSLKSHLQVHSAEKRHKCGYCSFSSRQEGNLHTHIKMKHPEKVTKRKKTKNNSKNDDEDDDDENVDDVSYKPDSKGKRKKGCKTSKPACQKTYKCTICDDSFVREDSLRCHLRHHMKQTCEPVALAMLELQDSVGNSQAPSQGSCTVSSSATTTNTLRNLDTSEAADVVSSTSMCQDEQSITVNSQTQLNHRAVHSSLPEVSPSVTNNSSATTASCALMSELHTFSSNNEPVSSSFSDETHSQADITVDRSFNPDTSSSSILQHLPGDTNEISNIPEESHIVLNISPPLSVADNFRSQDLSQEQRANEERGSFDLGSSRNSVQGNTYLATSVSSSVCNGVAAASTTSNSQQGSSTISRTEAATLLARIQNHTNLAREDNLHNTSVASTSLPPDLVAMPISSLLPITTTTQSQTVSWVPPVQVSPAVQTGVVSSLSSTDSNTTVSSSQPAVETAPQLMYPLQSGMGIIAIPLVSLNPGVVETDSVLSNNNNIPKAPISTIRSQNNVVSIPHSTTFIAPHPQTLVQFSGLQSNVQYILQPPAPPQAPSAIRLEVAGIQLSLGNNAVITSCPEPTVPSQTISSLSSPRVLTTAPSTGMGDLTFLLGSNNSTDTSQQMSNLTMPIMTDNTLNGTVMPAQNTFSKFVVGAVQGLSSGTNAAFNTPTQISQETLSSIIYPSLSQTSATNGDPKPIPLMVSPVYSIPDSAPASSLSGQGSSHQQ